MQSFLSTFQYEDAEVSSPDSHGEHLFEQITLNDKKAFRCLISECGKTFRFKSDMERHIIIHSKDRPYTCTFASCNKKFKRPDALKNHLQTHNEDFPFICTSPGCDEKFHKKAALQYHLLKHNNTEKFTCDFPGCQRSFLTYRHLKQHQSSVCYHQKVAACQASCQPSCQASCINEKRELDYFNFEDSSNNEYESLSFESKGNSFEGDFSPRSEKFLHLETGRGEACKFESATPEYSEGSTEMQSVAYLDQDIPEGMNVKDFIKLICKHLVQENQELKRKLANKSDTIQVSYDPEPSDHHLDSLFKKALEFQVDPRDF
jgi:hypothetical protein